MITLLYRQIVFFIEDIREYFTVSITDNDGIGQWLDIHAVSLIQTSSI